MKWIEEGAQNPLETNAALFEAALNEFAAHSYKEASLNEILKAAEMNKGSFYYRFHDKLELYLSLLIKIAGEKVATFQEYEAQTKDTGFFENFRQKAVVGLRFAKAEPRYHALFQRILEEENDIREVINAGFGGMMENMMEQMILRAKEAGELREDLPVQTTAFIISTLMNKIDTVISPDLEDEKILENVDTLLDILKNGMASKQ
ncbi:MAG TPA: TetR family transcriptional regulator [Oscillospiraceae bacterium]|nr:TetR family transcriptional regulator [Oscillospiraceae bacterium]HPF55314.1 TetR family transcriptional regulator [Clostridiales bacterium]HPK36102.1 TetR family transcriptional regulator [Oscillospiraceae bacterium]HPR76617.1 TetR family transcriptional regulator [Oscillospiraceae bacterium]